MLHRQQAPACEVRWPRHEPAAGSVGCTTRRLVRIARNPVLRGGGGWGRRRPIRHSGDDSVRRIRQHDHGCLWNKARLGEATMLRDSAEMQLAVPAGAVWLNTRHSRAVVVFAGARRSAMPLRAPRGVRGRASPRHQIKVRSSPRDREIVVGQITTSSTKAAVIARCRLGVTSAQAARKSSAWPMNSTTRSSARYCSSDVLAAVARQSRLVGQLAPRV